MSGNQWVQKGGLPDFARAVLVGVHVETEPGAAREFHLGAKLEIMTGLDTLNPPEVERVTRQQVLGVTAVAAHPDTTPDAVDKTTDAPQPVEYVPALLPTDRSKSIPSVSCNAFEGGVPRGTAASALLQRVSTEAWLVRSSASLTAVS